jgi:1-acyl-sn-glycerol-3-phosphate acyltransferase
MLDVVSEQPYQFVPPYQGRFWWWILRPFLDAYLSRFWGIERVEILGAEQLRASLDAGHGILLTPNHARPCDPLVLGALSRDLRQPFFAIGSWHLFMNGGWQPWLLNRIGAFSIYREGMDRAAMDAAIDILVHARRPLIIFPEGVISRANDRLNPLLEGTAFIARTAARRRSKATPAGQVVVHPIALRYRFHGNVQAAIAPVLEEIERRLTWPPQRSLPPRERIVKVGHALLSLKEIEYLGQPQPGTIGERLSRLIDHILAPLEAEWNSGVREATVVARVKKLRTAILPDLVKGELSESEKDRRWRQLTDCNLAQQLSWYPPDYLASHPTAERLLETVERFEEDLMDAVRPYRPMSVRIDVGPALAVSPDRDRAAVTDPVLEHIERELSRLLAESAAPLEPSEA